MTQIQKERQTYYEYIKAIATMTKDSSWIQTDKDYEIVILQVEPDVEVMAIKKEVRGVTIYEFVTPDHVFTKDPDNKLLNDSVNLYLHKYLKELKDANQDRITG